MNIGNIVSNNFNLDSNGKDMQIEVYEQLIEQLQQENKRQKEQITIMEKYFELIIDLSFDYDGCNTIESLKQLIDELSRFAKLGRVCNVTEPIYENGCTSYNIFNQELVEVEK